MRRLLGVPYFLLLCLLAACGGNGTGNTPAASNDVTAPAEATSTDTLPLQKIRLPMGYIADPQYAPFYVAVEKGYFADAGIELEFDYSFETDGIALVGAGALPFAIASGEQVLLARAQKLPIVYVFEWFQQFPIAVISKAEAGIVVPTDLRGRNLGLPGFFGANYVGYVGMLLASGMTQDEVNVSEIGFTQVEALFRDQVEVIVGYTNNEPLQLANMGEAVNVIYVSDYIDLVSNGIITNETTIANDPALIQRFVNALLKGLQDTLANPDEAYEISKKYVEGLDDSRRDVLTASLSLWQAEQLGLTEPDSWVQTHTVLLSMGFLDAPIEDLPAAYTNRFVDAAAP
ncbi:MAG: ABC transporter substrate-binding protein [Anaerolineae bacterium]|nr:ABC transporter substrate-binding protein [Anaerolineae bacterium]